MMWRVSVVGRVVCLLCAAAAVYGADGLGDGACSGRGYWEPDSLRCECFQCFSGPKCEVLDDANCTMGMVGGDPRLFQDYWRHVNATSVAVADYRSPYQFEMVLHGLPVSGMVEPLGTTIKQLHKLAGNAKTEGYSIVFGHGGTQIINAALWALSHEIEDSIVFAQPPYYDGYEGAASIGYHGTTFNASLGLPQERVIEFVTVPNNPTGFGREPVHNAPAALVHDLVYWWPSLTKVHERADDLMIFSLSKLTGHAGTRFGWALVKDPAVAMLMQKFIATMELHVSIDAQLRALRILQHVVGSEGDLFNWLRPRFAKRWGRILAAFSYATSRFSLECQPGQFYIWVRCLDTSMSCVEQFGRAKIAGEAGPSFGSSEAYVRIAIVLHDVEFDLFMERLEALVKPGVTGVVVV